ncbi:hypothetical protein [Endozoicomonas sp. ONNA1]|uniref:hypothetical protein n=1 Tax=Endozoicomonas sp. ONNA1 TaxID=2828740 RepID=UPI0021476A80|nr:hypothetical protein [Endozoicomonas sp. ONNA1]
MELHYHAHISEVVSSNIVSLYTSLQELAKHSPDDLKDEYSAIVEAHAFVIYHRLVTYTPKVDKQLDKSLTLCLIFREVGRIIDERPRWPLRKQRYYELISWMIKNSLDNKTQIKNIILGMLQAPHPPDSFKLRLPGERLTEYELLNLKRLLLGTKLKIIK